MRAAAKDATPGRLAPALVRKVFSVYFVLAMAVTAIQIALEYRETYSQVVHELGASASAFRPGMADAVWNFQASVAESIAQGAADGRLVLGVRVKDDSGHIQVEAMHPGVRAKDLTVSHRIDLTHVERDGTAKHIGEMVLYSSHNVVLGRVQYGLILAFCVSLVKTAGLWLIIVYFANLLLSKPLVGLTRQIGSFDVTHAKPAPLPPPEPGASAELRYLNEAFNDMANRLHDHQSRLNELTAQLERRVEERTRELSEKNAALIEEIRVREAAEKSAARQRDFSQTLVKSIPEVFLLVGPKGRIMMSNPSGQALLGLTEEKLQAVPLLDLVAPHYHEPVLSMITAAQTGKESSCEADLLMAGSRAAPHYLVGHGVQLDDSEHCIVVAVDITVRRQAEDQMRQLAHHDSLTQLPNRMMLHDRLAQAVALAQRRKECMAVLFIDLDGFKAINDGQGHEAGDEVLREVAKRLRQQVRASDTVARYGGDEFVVVLPFITGGQTSAAEVARKLIDAISLPIDWSGTELRVGASIGIALMPDHASDGKALLDAADAAMYIVKRRGKRGYEFAATEGAVPLQGAEVPG